MARSTKKTRERKVLLYDSEESDDDDIPEQRHPQRKAETDAKAGETRHSSRHSNGTSKRAADPADAKVSSTQHTPHGSTQEVENRTTDRPARDKDQQAASMPDNTSTKEQRRDRRRSSSRKEEPYSPLDPSMSSSEEEIVAPRHIMKPPKFDGQCSRTR